MRQPARLVWPEPFLHCQVSRLHRSHLPAHKPARSLLNSNKSKRGMGTCMCRLSFLVVFSLLLVVSVSRATIFGTVRGVVHDPQHRPVPDVQVVLKARASAFTLTAQTDVNGEFHFDAVPVAEYTITVSKTGFATEEQAVTVLSGTAPI